MECRSEALWGHYERNRLLTPPRPDTPTSCTGSGDEQTPSAATREESASPLIGRDALVAVTNRPLVCFLSSRHSGLASVFVGRNRTLTGQDRPLVSFPSAHREE